MHLRRGRALEHQTVIYQRTLPAAARTFTLVVSLLLESTITTTTTVPPAVRVHSRLSAATDPPVGPLLLATLCRRRPARLPGVATAALVALRGVFLFGKFFLAFSPDARKPRGPRRSRTSFCPYYNAVVFVCLQVESISLVRPAPCPIRRTMNFT